jgi:hypothetical protein
MPGGIKQFEAGRHNSAEAPATAETETDIFWNNSQKSTTNAHRTISSGTIED